MEIDLPAFFGWLNERSGLAGWAQALGATIALCIALWQGKLTLDVARRAESITANQHIQQALHASTVAQGALGTLVIALSGDPTAYQHDIIVKNLERGAKLLEAASQNLGLHPPLLRGVELIFLNLTGAMDHIATARQGNNPDVAEIGRGLFQILNKELRDVGVQWQQIARAGGVSEKDIEETQGYFSDPLSAFLDSKQQYDSLPV